MKQSTIRSDFIVYILIEYGYILTRWGREKGHHFANDFLKIHHVEWKVFVFSSTFTWISLQ